MPINKPPNKVPIRLPTPPTMMAIKLGISRSSPILGLRPIFPAARTPLNPAKRQPTAKCEGPRGEKWAPGVESVSHADLPGGDARPPGCTRRERKRADPRHEDT